jgi:hypothetical protein
MAAYIVKTLPKSFKGDSVVLKDLTQEVLITNDEKMARSCVSGSIKATAAFFLPTMTDERGEPVAVFNNLNKVNMAKLVKTTGIRLAKPQPIRVRARRGLFQGDSSRTDKPAEREIIVERV